MSAERVTLTAVAATAGVSVATVSKVLNGRPDVAPATRRRVQEALHEHRYAGRHVGVGGEILIELLFHGELSAYSAAVIQGASAAASAAGAAVTVAVRPRATPADPAQWARSLVHSGRRAVVAAASQLGPDEAAALARVHLPLVVIDPLAMPTAEVTSVGSTNFRGGLQAARHLLGLGHRRIGFLGGQQAAECNQARLQGFRAALEAEGVPLPGGHVRHAPSFSYANGLSAGEALLAQPEPPTAIFAANDELAVGLLEVARRRGVRVPADLSVVGFDDTPVAGMASPPLTTVRQPLQDMAAVAVRTALRLVAGDPIDSHHVELATELVVRGSTVSPG